MSKAARNRAAARIWRRSAFNRQKGMCFWCDREMVRGNQAGFQPGAHTPLRVTSEHVVPTARGGSNRRANIAAACMECNNRRKDSCDGEWDVAKRLQVWAERWSLWSVDDNYFRSSDPLAVVRRAELVLLL